MRQSGLTMRFDMIKVGSILESGIIPIQVLHPLMDEWVSVSNGAEIALEVPMIHRVEPDHCREQTYVRFRRLVSNQEIFFAFGFLFLYLKHALNPIERFEERLHGFLIGLLGGGKTRAVDTIWRVENIRSRYWG
jgi:hypothetical protein